MNQIEPGELIVAEDVVVPKPLDPAIASVLLRHKSNRLSDGYNLSVSAFFGSEKVRLIGGEFSVDVKISIDRARIQLEFVKCTPSLLEIDDPTNSDTRVISENSSSERRRKGSQNISLKASSSDLHGADVGGQLGFEAENTGASGAEMTRQRRNWQRISETSVLVGTAWPGLDGMELDELLGWYVIPDSQSERSGVVASVCVREDWINFVDIQVDSLRGKIGEKAKRLLESRDQTRKRMFALLMRHLATEGLNSSKNPNEAVLAVYPFVVRPESEYPVVAQSAAPDGQLPLDSEKLELFLSSPPGSEIESLVSLGVSHEVIREEKSTITSKPSKKKLFWAGSSPVNALKGYSEILRRGGVPQDQWVEIVGVARHSLTDLTRLGLVKLENGVAVPLDSNVSDPEAMVRRAASKAESITTTRAMMIEDEAVPGSAVCEMLTTKFGKKYTSEATKTRVGNALKVWARWLEPHLIDPMGGAKSQAALELTRSNQSQRGAPSYATKSSIEFAKNAYARGMLPKDIAAELGINTETVRRWKRSGRLD